MLPLLRNVTISSVTLRLTFGVLLSLPVMAQAAPKDFGGYPERFKGEGDNIPPECQIDIPLAATAPFTIKWNCIDDNANPQDITTELWIYRNGSQSSEPFTKFLGFPAAAYIDATALHVTDFAAGLPVSFRLLARDRAGVSAITSFLTVSKQASTLSNCNLQITTQATDSTGSTTGTPEMSVTVANAEISSQDVSDNKLRVFTAAKTSANPCEISSVCEDGDEVTFSGTFTTASDDSVTGTFAVSPGSVSVEMTGTVTKSDSALVTDLEASGTTTIDGSEATVTLTCSD